METIIKQIQEALDQEIRLDYTVNENLMQRGIADIIEQDVSKIILNLKSRIIKESYEAKSKRSIEDVGLITNDYDDVKIDIKTHDTESELSMPNLISIARLKKFYENDKNLLVYVFVKYINHGNNVQVTQVRVKPIEQINWECLTIGNLGKGQLQITDMNKISFQNFMTRKDWMERLSYDAVIYYQKLIDKIQNNWIKEWL
tara:strand:+ start:2799 stop:3401 length:603 start_codon:yes stop_codon:yes gene_type:complete